VPHVFNEMPLNAAAGTTTFWLLVVVLTGRIPQEVRTTVSAASPSPDLEPTRNGTYLWWPGALGLKRFGCWLWTNAIEGERTCDGRYEAVCVTALRKSAKSRCMDVPRAQCCS
jgi:hypothetical protein